MQLFLGDGNVVKTILGAEPEHIVCTLANTYLNGPA